MDLNDVCVELRNRRLLASKELHEKLARFRAFVDRLGPRRWQRYLDRPERRLR